MRSTTLLQTLFFAATTTFAASETSVSNNCSFPVYYFPVDSTGPTTAQIIGPGGYLMQPQWFDNKTGTALKITKTADGLWTDKPVLNFGYTVKDGATWYDISTINGFDFWGEKITLEGNKEGAERIEWDGAPGPVKIAHYAGELDLVLEICA
jgi:hypothetical protein